MESDLPRYKCHKVVQAGKIISIGYFQAEMREGDKAAWLSFSEGSSVEVDKKWLTRFEPKIGGYYVLYEDGYASFSPAEAFEKGYTRI